MPQESRYSLQMDHSSLVDYGYGAPSPKAAYRNSDIDFRDVFGGPPLRASVHDVRYSFTEGMESSAVSDRSSGEASLRDPWTGAEEKPVFGGEESVNRQHLREDFFDDIFKGGESPSSTPRNVFSSSPGSRVMSPARPLPPRDDGFGSPSAPSQLSLPDKLSKGIELPTFGSTTTAHESPKDDTAPNRGSPLHSPKMSVFGFSTRVQEDSRNSHHPSYRPSPLSQQFSLGSQELFEPTKSAEKSEDLKKDSEEVTQFHFSIYKWADKGIPIPLVMPLRRTNSAKLKERRKTEVSSFTEVPETLSPAPEPVPVTLQSVIDSGFSVSDPDSVFYGMEGSESNSGSKDADVAVHDVPRNGRGMEASEIKGMKLDQVLKEEVREELKSDSKVGSGDEIKRRILDQVLKEEVREEPKRNSKTELKPLRSFFHDEQNKPGNAAEYATNEKNRERQRNKKVPKKDDVKKDEVFKKQQNATELPVPKKEDVKKVTPPQKTVAPENTTKRRGKNKVKDFIRIFNQEPTPSKSKTTPNSPPSRSSRWKETPATVEAAATQQENSQRSAVDERIINMSYVEEVPKKEPDASSDTIGSIHRPLQKEDSITNTAKPPPSHPSSDPTQRNTSSSRNETVTEDARETVEEADDSSQTSFTIKELSAEDESKQEQSTEDKDEIQAMDAKIRQWSRGKEGNIRSLLSTLQYVLWPGSGWKPVPLVNIIEGPGVKRAYQKAMLCLHPDKLQQKGASSHQKYLAEKVFDILQEAWDHFNTLGGL